MKKYFTFNGKWFFIMVVMVIGMLGPNNNFHHNVSHAASPLEGVQSQMLRVTPIIDPLQLECLAKGIYYEARGESVKGQIAVARVIMNRVKHHAFGSTPCKVINQANIVKVITDAGQVQKVKVCQFSWVCEPKPPINKNSAGYQNALDIARDVLEHDAHNDLLPQNTLYFHSKAINPNWGHKKVAVIGNHVFYATKKDNK